MRIVAIVAARDEERLIGPCLEHLIDQGIEAYLIDDGSADGTVSVAERYMRRGLIGIESLEGDGSFSLRAQLERKERLARELDADWLIHQDADEFRVSRDGGQTLAEAIEAADRAGFNAVNFTEFTFLPTRESPDHDHPGFLETMRWYYPFLPRFPHRLNAWKRQDDAVELAWSGGHAVRFPGLRMAPESLAMRHYLCLSAGHARRKFVERRYDPSEVAAGWHRWRVSLTPAQLAFPSRRDMRTYLSDDRLDPSRPRVRHLLGGAGTTARVARFPASRDRNPYQRLLYGELSKLGVELAPDATLGFGWLLRSRRRVEAIHFHWRLDLLYMAPGSVRRRRLPPRPRALLSWPRLGLFVLRLALARRLGYRLVWTVHEVHPHELGDRRIDEVAARALCRLCHALLVHDGATAERLRSEIGCDPRRVAIVPHGSYAGVYPAGRSRSATRRELGIPEDAFAFVCFGDLRGYKDIEVLLEAFVGLPNDDVRLVVAGRVLDPEVGESALEAARRDPRIHARLGFVPDDRVSELFAAADAAVNPRGDGWTSGSLVLAMSQGVAVVAARRPAYAELLGEGEAGWLFEPGDAASLRRALAGAAGDPTRAMQKGAAARRRAQRLRWEDAAAGARDALVGDRNHGLGRRIPD